MGLFQFTSAATSRTRRAVRASVWGSGVDRFEDRTLLSGVAICPQPAVVAIEKTDTAAAPTLYFGGSWNIDSTEGSGSASVKYLTENEIVVVAFFDGTAIELHGKVKGETAKIKVKQTIEGFNVKGKITATLDSPTEMSGTAKAKIAGLGKFTVPFTGTHM